jgi:hypothetical protein
LFFLVDHLVDRDELITSWRHPGVWHAVCALHKSLCRQLLVQVLWCAPWDFHQHFFPNNIFLHGFF